MKQPYFKFLVGHDMKYVLFKKVFAMRMLFFNLLRKYSGLQDIA